MATKILSAHNQATRDITKDSPDDKYPPQQRKAQQAPTTMDLLAAESAKSAPTQSHSPTPTIATR